MEIFKLLGTIAINKGEVTADIKEVEKQAEKSSSNIQKSFEKVGGGIKKFGDGMTKVGGTITKWISGPLTALGASAIAVGAAFDAQMSRVQALSGATGEEFGKLRDLAKELGATTRFSATEAAQGMEFMALAGWNTQQTMAGLPGVLDLAAAAGMDLARASDIVTDTMSAFGLEAERATYVADQFAAAQSKSNTSVEQLGEAMVNVAPTAANLGMTLGDTSAALGMLADQGIKGGRAGTTLNAVLADMTANAEGGRLEFGAFSVEVFDAQGNFRDFGAILRDVEAGTADLTDEQRANALGQVFQRQSLRGLNALLGEGADRYDELSAAIADSSGLAAEQAEIMEDNVAGGFTALRSQMEGLLIQLSDELSPTIKDLIIPALQDFGKRISNLIQWFSDLDPKWQQVILAAGGFLALLGPLLMALGPVIGGFGTLITTLGSVAGAIGGLTLPMVAVGAGLAVLVALVIRHWDEIKQVIDMAIGFIKDIISAAIELITAWWDEWGETILAVWDELASAGRIIFEDLQFMFLMVFEAIRDIIMSVWDTLVPYLEWAWGHIQALAEFVFGFLQAFWEDWGGTITDIFWIVWDQIYNIFSTAINLIKDVIGLVMALIRGDWEEVWNRILSIGETIWAFITASIGNMAAAMEAVMTGLSNTLSRIWDSIVAKITEVWNGIKQFFTDYWPVLLAIFTGGLSLIVGLLINNWDSITATIHQVWDSIAQFLGGTWDTIKGTISAAIEWIKGALSSAWESITSGVSGAWNGIAGTVKGVWDGIQSTIKGGVNGIIGMINRFIGGINKIKIKVPSVDIPLVGKVGGFTIGMPQIPTIPMLAKGGNILDDGLFIVGEEGPELMSNAKGARVSPLGKEAGVTINITGNSFRDRSDLDYLVSELRRVKI